MNSISQTNLKTLFQKALSLHQANALKEAETFYLKVLQINPKHEDSLINLGVLYKKQGLWQKALQCYKKALTLTTHSADLHYNLANLYNERNFFPEAIKHYQESLKLNPQAPAVLNNLGMLFCALGENQKGLKCYQKALTLDPDNLELLNNIGNFHKKQCYYSLAEKYYRKILLIKPDFTPALNNLAVVCKYQGNLKEALNFYQKAINLSPPDVHSIYSNKLFTLNYLPTLSPDAIAIEHLYCGRTFFDPKTPLRDFKHLKKKKNKLRIGYLSPDFHQHSVSYFSESIIQHHNQKQFEIFCYFDKTQEDETTLRFKQYATCFKEINGLTDKEILQTILNDEIDILIDLAGHTSNNKLTVFALRAAPIQITYIGYPNTSGLKAMDYRIVDHFTDPPGQTEKWHSEHLIRPNPCFLCYKPALNSPKINDLPALKNNFLTFGSFNNFAKINTQTLSVWANVLNAVPNAKLIIKSESTNDETCRQNFLKQLAKVKIDPKRLEILPFTAKSHEHLSLYHKIDIALDTFPYNGTTTTFEALWMGVPVFTIAGTAHVSRVSLSILANLKLFDLIAPSLHNFAEYVLKYTQNLNLLQELRQSLRTKMSSSPLLNAKLFTINLEKNFYTLWQNWYNS